MSRFILIIDTGRDSYAVRRRFQAGWELRRKQRNKLGSLPCLVALGPDTSRCRSRAGGSFSSR
eukprot:scaffold58147_cov60-Attheya_sp.AAC.5